MPTLLSVNVNKYALLRNSRGGDAPNLLEAVDTCLRAGAHGITVHPRLDERHVRRDDVAPLIDHLRARWPGIEANIECEPDPGLIEQVCATRPEQCTLVPVRPGEVTSDHGWDLPAQTASLRPVVETLHAHGIRVSLFADCEPDVVRAAVDTGADRVELYTGPYAWAWGTDAQAHEEGRLRAAAAIAAEVGLGLNAGHDLDRHNLVTIADITNLAEVSIGHAQICRALEVGTRQSVRELLAALGHPVDPAG